MTTKNANTISEAPSVSALTRNKKQKANGGYHASLESVANLSIAEAVKILRENGCETLTVAEFKRQIASGAPTNPDGTIDLVNYTAWVCGNRNSRK